jgi:HD-like signal output (HDOD) protein
MALMDTEQEVEAPVAGPQVATEDLVRDLDTLPAQQAVALRVLHVSGDSRSSATDLASALMADPAMTAQVIRLANSAYYGLSGRVSSVPFAVTVIGFVSIRSVVAAFAAGALGGEAQVPPGFWERAAASAASSSIVAPRIGAAGTDAFSIGMLHELGDFLLYRVSPEAHAEIHAAADHWDCRRRCRIERALFGLDHGQALSRCLSAWMFPEDFVDAIDQHAEATRVGNPLARSLVAGQAIGALALHPDEQRRAATELAGRLTSRLEVGGIEPMNAWQLSRQARHDAATLAASFSVET